MTLDPSDVDAALSELEGWANAGDALTKTFAFADFARSGPTSTTGSTSG